MLRLTGGEFRGRGIQSPDSDRTRPTQAKLRQALFNSLQMLIPDARVLDLFAGSGSLGLEALSRGAAMAVFVESAPPVSKIIQNNINSLGVKERSRLIASPVEKAIAQLLPLGPFDVVLADPPYTAGWELRLLEEFPWDQLLAPDGCLCLEWGTQKSKIQELPEQLIHLVKIREKKYGESMLTTYRRITP